MKRIIIGATLIAMFVATICGVIYDQHFSSRAGPSRAGALSQSQVQEEYANGNVKVVVQSPRHFGHRIGEPVPVEIIIIARPSAKVNVDAILDGTFGEMGSDFELVSPPQVNTWKQDGHDITSLSMKVRTWVTVDQKGNPRNDIAFNATFLYSTSTIKGNPNWRPAVTPDLMISTSPTITDSASSLIAGDMFSKEHPDSPLVSVLRLLTLALLAAPLGYGLIRLYFLINPRRDLPANKRAWLELNKVCPGAAIEAGLTYAQTAQVAHIIRKYLQVESVPSSKSDKALEYFFKTIDIDRMYELARVARQVLTVLDQALYDEPENVDAPALSAADYRSLFNNLEQIIPSN